MVSVLDGQLSRTWNFLHNNRKHVINLYHDTITGMRSAMLDFQEIRGSTGNSSVFMEARGHRIFFSVEDLPGYLEIKRSGWTGFVYTCVINDKTIPETTEIITPVYQEIFKPKIIGTILVPDEASEHPVTWYLVKTTRLVDGVTTQVHRRFRDFVELNSQIKANFKGNHLLQALPPLPEKPLKVMTDHRDPVFIQDRALKLEVFLLALVNVPHVQDMVCTKAFLGLMESVREHSVSFHTPQLGISLLAGNSAKAPYGVSPDNVAVVGCIQKSEHCEDVRIGDALSKINGVTVQGYTFEGLINRVRIVPRPVVVHFIQIIGGLPAAPEGSSKQQAVKAAAAPVTDPDDLLAEIINNPAPPSKDQTTAPAPEPTPALASAPEPVVKKLNPAVEELFRDPAPASSSSARQLVEELAPTTTAPVMAPTRSWRKNQLFAEEDLEDLTISASAPAGQSAMVAELAPETVVVVETETETETGVEAVEEVSADAEPAAAVVDEVPVVPITISAPGWD